MDHRESRIAPPGSTPLANPSRLWRSVNANTKSITTLEVRKYDDARGGFADTRHGAVMLYHDKSAPIFPSLSSLDLMMMQ